MNADQIFVFDPRLSAFIGGHKFFSTSEPRQPAREQSRSSGKTEERIFWHRAG
jgi:hypothetical protein